MAFHLVTANKKPVPFPLNVVVLVLVLPLVVGTFLSIALAILGIMVLLTAPIWLPILIVILLLT